MSNVRRAAAGGPHMPPSVSRIPQATVGRLAQYLEVLGSLVEQGVRTVSSDELASAAGVGSAKLRKDLSHLGRSGIRGVGYDVTRLRERIEHGLGLDRQHRVVLVGIGSLGTALARYPGFDRRGFRMVGLFDRSPARVGERIGNLTVRDVVELPDACRELRPTVGVVATPDAPAPGVARTLADGGVQSILNFTAADFELPARIEQRRVDLSIDMQVLTFNSIRDHEHGAGGRAHEGGNEAASGGVMESGSAAVAGNTVVATGARTPRSSGSVSAR